MLLDLGLPDGDGLQVCRQLRRRHNCGVIMLTARGEPRDRVLGLRTGADDYVVKPFGLEELLARIDAVARRTRTDRARAETPRDHRGRSARPRRGRTAGVGDRPRSSGLGLAIVAELVTAVDGTVELRDAEPGLAVITLPVAAAPEPSGHAAL